MVEDGLWLSRSQRRVFHRPQLRRENVADFNALRRIADLKKELAVMEERKNRFSKSRSAI